MLNPRYHGVGEVLQGNNNIGMFNYELGVAHPGKETRTGIIFIGDRIVPFSALQGEDLTLRLEDGALCKFRITKVDRKMAIMTVGAPVDADS